MQQITIPMKRAELLSDKKLMKEITERLGCKITISNGNEVEIDGNALSEFDARNVIQAFARGFDFNVAFKLLSDDYFFSTLDMKDSFRNEGQIERMRARLIGTEGRTKKYIEAVSGAYLSIYGNSVSMIGTTDEIKIASAAVNILLEGGTHSAAYTVMEKTKRKISR
jgi:ribosomal RNA assembly protein